MSARDDLLAILEEVIGALNGLGLAYFVTGSFASSVHGEVRATNDLDIVVELDEQRAAALVEALAATFVGDPDQARLAVAEGGSFNLVHRAAFLKVDVFPLRSAFDRSALARAESVQIPGVKVALRSATREDILLAKLRWYRMTGETSERQRRDVEALVSLNRAEFDRPYLDRWAEALGVDDLLARFIA